MKFQCRPGPSTPGVKGSSSPLLLTWTSQGKQLIRKEVLVVVERKRRVLLIHQSRVHYQINPLNQMRAPYHIRVQIIWIVLMHNPNIVVHDIFRLIVYCCRGIFCMLAIQKAKKAYLKSHHHNASTESRYIILRSLFYVVHDL